MRSPRMGDDLSGAIHDDDVSGNATALQSHLNLSQRSDSNSLRDAPAAHLQNMLRRVRFQNGAAVLRLRTLGQPRKINLRAPRMQIHGALRQLHHFAETTTDGEARHRIDRQILEQASGKVAHVEHGCQRQSMVALHCVLRCRSRAPRHMGKARRPRHVDAAMDGSDPRRTRERIDDPRGAKNRQAADNAQPSVPGFLRQCAAAGNGDFDFRTTPKFRNNRFHHLPWHGVDGGLSDSHRQTGQGYCTDTLSRLERHTRCSPPHGRHHHAAMGDIGIIASVFDDPRPRPINSALLQRQRKRNQLTLGQGDFHGIGKAPVQEGRERSLGGGSGASPCRPTVTQCLLWLLQAHEAWV